MNPSLPSIATPIFLPTADTRIISKLSGRLDGDYGKTIRTRISGS